jgi:hypothetical protein
MLGQSKLASARQAYKICFYFGQISIISVIEMVPAKNKKKCTLVWVLAQTFYLEQIAQGPDCLANGRIQNWQLK